MALGSCSELCDPSADQAGLHSSCSRARAGTACRDFPGQGCGLPQFLSAELHPSCLPSQHIHRLGEWGYPFGVIRADPQAGRGQDSRAPAQSCEGVR